MMISEGIEVNNCIGLNSLSIRSVGFQIGPTVPMLVIYIKLYNRMFIAEICLDD